VKFKFKIQQYQTETVANTTAVFTGQPNRDPSKYRRDLEYLEPYNKEWGWNIQTHSLRYYVAE